MGLPIGHRNGLPIPVGSRSGLERIKRRHGIPFYSPIRIPSSIKYVNAVTDILFFTSGIMIDASIPIPTSIKGQSTVLFLNQGSMIRAGNPILPEAMKIKAEMMVKFWNTAIISSSKLGKLVGVAWTTFYDMLGTLEDGFVAAPYDLTITTESDVHQTLSWSLGDTYNDGILIEWSTNGVDFTQIATISGSATSQGIAPPQGSRQYWYRIRGVKNGHYSDYSNTVDAWTAWKIVVPSGNNTVMVFGLTMNGGGRMTIDGNGMLYSDYACTSEIGQEFSWSGTGNSYCKVSSGSANIYIFHDNHLTGIGNVLDYGGNYWGIWDSGNGIVIELSDLPRSVEMMVFSVTELNGELSDLPDGLKRIYSQGGSGFITGDLSDLHEGFEVLYIMSPNDISGDVADLPQSSVTMYFWGTGSVYGDVADIPSGNLKYFFHYLQSGVITGDIAGLNQENTVLKQIILQYLTTVSGDIADLPPSLELISIWGYNTLEGDIANINEGVTIFQISGLNTIEGDIANLSSTIQNIDLHGYNTVTGDIADFPASLVMCRISGNNDITGDIANLPANMFLFEFGGVNTLYGDIADLSSVMGQFQAYGGNTITGDIANLPASITSIALGGLNTVYGDIGGIPSTLNWMRFSGRNSISDYSGRTWPATISGYVEFIPYSGGLSSAEVDDILNDISSVVTEYKGWFYITLTGTNGGRTSASDAAVTSLESYNVHVLTN